MTALAEWQNFYVHNAWDAVTYHVFVKKREQREVEQSIKSKE